MDLLVGTGYDGVLSIECEGQGGPMIERSLAWVRNTLTEIASRVGEELPEMRLKEGNVRMVTTHNSVSSGNWSL